MAGSCVMIVNPAAGGGRAAHVWPDVSWQLAQAGMAHTVLLTRRPGEATELCRRALQEGAATIIAAGGDGTLNEVANGFFSADGDNVLVQPAAALGLLPLGTGADFARSLGIRRDAAIEPLVAGITAHIDVGRVDFHNPQGLLDHRYFVNVADLGLGAETARWANRAPKAFGPLLTYLIGAIRSILVYRPQSVAVSLDGGALSHEQTGLVNIANSRYFGGGMPVVPDAELDDGLLDVIQLLGANRRQMLFDLLPKLYHGAHLRHPAVRRDRVAAVTLESEDYFPLEVDGDPIGRAPATFSVLPRSLRVIVPQNWYDARVDTRTQQLGPCQSRDESRRTSILSC